MQSIKYGCIEATAYWGKLLWASSKYDEKWIQQQLNEFGDFAVYAMSFLEKSAKYGHIESYYWLGHCFLEIPMTNVENGGSVLKVFNRYWTQDESCSGNNIDDMNFNI